MSYRGIADRIAADYLEHMASDDRERSTSATELSKAQELLAFPWLPVEQGMRLKVNADKSDVRQPSDVHFLGFRFQCRTVTA